MDTALIVLALGQRSRALSFLVTEAHRAATKDTPFAIDLPGASNLLWSKRHSWPLGRVGILYGPSSYCERVRKALLEIGATLPFDEAFTAIPLAETRSVIDAFSSDRSMYVVRRPLRRLSLPSREKVAERLRAHLQKEGQEATDVRIIERSHYDKDFRFVVTLHPGHEGERETRNILRILSGTTGRYFANLIERLPSNGIPLQGRRDSYGFAARHSETKGADGRFADIAPDAVSVPDVDEERVIQRFLGA